MLLAIAMAVVLIPAARQAQRDRAAAESTERAERRAQGIRALQAEQRPRYGRSDSVAAGARATRRGRAASRWRDLEAAIAADARTRGLPGRSCARAASRSPPPSASRRPRTTCTRRRGGYACLAITSEIERTSRNAAGVLGHPYRAAVDFDERPLRVLQGRRAARIRSRTRRSSPQAVLSLSRS